MHHQNKQTYSVTVALRFLVPSVGVRIPVGLQTILFQGWFLFFYILLGINKIAIVTCYNGYLANNYNYCYLNKSAASLKMAAKEITIKKTATIHPL